MHTVTSQDLAAIAELTIAGLALLSAAGVALRFVVRRAVKPFRELLGEARAHVSELADVIDQVADLTNTFFRTVGENEDRFTRLEDRVGLTRWRHPAALDRRSSA